MWLLFLLPLLFQIMCALTPQSVSLLLTKMICLILGEMVLLPFNPALLLWLAVPLSAYFYV